MNEKKTAQVVLRDDGMLALFDPEYIYEPKIVLYQDDVKALRAFFQEERDGELNRWRDPLNPDMVCYPIANKMLVDLHVLNERTGESFYYARDSVIDQPSYKAFETAVRYYASHPIMHPWEGAKVGEYWLVTWSHSSEPEPCFVVSIYGDLFFKSITECRELSSRYIEHAQKLIAEEN